MEKWVQWRIALRALLVALLLGLFEPHDRGAQGAHTPRRDQRAFHPGRRKEQAPAGSGHTGHDRSGRRDNNKGPKAPKDPKDPDVPKIIVSSTENSRRTIIISRSQPTDGKGSKKQKGTKGKGAARWMLTTRSLWGDRRKQKHLKFQIRLGGKHNARRPKRAKSTKPRTAPSRSVNTAAVFDPSAPLVTPKRGQQPHVMTATTGALEPPIGTHLASVTGVGTEEKQNAHGTGQRQPGTTQDAAAVLKIHRADQQRPARQGKPPHGVASDHHRAGARHGAQQGAPGSRVRQLQVSSPPPGGLLPGQICNNNQTVCSIFSQSNPGFDACCGRACRNLQTDELNCGACSRTCPASNSCCGGGCVNTGNDNNHCGGCFLACSGGTLCVNGVCENYGLPGRR